VPEKLSGDIRVGSRVRIPLHGRRVAAWVVEVDVEPPEGVVVQPLAASSGFGPPASVVSLAEWAAWRWAGPPSSFLGTASPERNVRALPVRWTPAPAVAVAVAAAGAGAGQTAGSVAGQTAGRGAAAPGPAGAGSGSGPGSGSGEADTIIDQALGAGHAVVRLAPALDPILLVEAIIRRRDRVLVVAPSHQRVDQIAARLRGSGIPLAVLPDGWADAAAGAPVVVGTRIAAWAPTETLGAVLVIDAHDEAYREERTPTWSAVDVLIERARRDDAPCVLVTPCPTVSLLEGVTLVHTSRAIERRGWPPVEVVDRREDDPRTGLFSERLSQLFHSALPHGRVVCILNRTGRARLLACASCGSLASCTRCGGALEQQDAGGVLRCRRCGLERPVVCAVCDSTRMKLLRMGVSRAREELSALMGMEAVEISATSAPGVGSPDSGDHLIVGTEAALHRVGRADVVAFLDFDQHLLASRFAAGEGALALLARAARVVGGRGGRGGPGGPGGPGGREGGGRVLVQTRQPDHPALSAAVHADPSRLTDGERELRAGLGLPPFAALATVGGAAAEEMVTGLRGVEGLSLSSLVDEKWLVKAPDHRTLCDGLAAVPRPSGRLRVEVDPTDV
jgi:primosomal protein N' (replication factor Y) (superfamily II helicase)